MQRMPMDANVDNYLLLNVKVTMSALLRMLVIRTHLPPPDKQRPAWLLAVRVFCLATAIEKQERKPAEFSDQVIVALVRSDIRCQPAPNACRSNVGSASTATG